MSIRIYITIIGLLFTLSSCKDEKGYQEAIETDEHISSDLQVDHLNIWVNDPQKAKEKLTDIGFNSVPDSLSQIHHGQGTAGRYFNFLNSYLELIFVYDKDELEENSLKNEGLDFTERANFEQNEASPFSIALKLKKYEVEKIPFEKVRYHQEWMEKGASIFSAKTSKTHLKEPSIFVVYPEIESNVFESLSVLQSIPSEDDFWKEWFRHPNGAQKLTNIIITSTASDLNSETVKAVNKVKNITIKKGKEHLMELYFDENVQGKSFDLRPELPLIVYL